MRSQKDGKRVDLFFSTTDEAIQEDFGDGDVAALSRSLGWWARSHNRRDIATEETNHIDLATGVCMAMARNGYEWVPPSPPTKVDKIPEGLREVTVVGGSGRELLVRVYEQELEEAIE